MAAVTVFRWDDIGAPQMGEGKPSDIIAILQACLVDGYGSKTALGWTKEYEDVGTTAAAFRNNIAAGGSGGYCKFWALNGTNTARNLLSARSSQGMSDINTQIKEAYECGINVAFTSWTQWAIIGTSSAFYFIISDADKSDLMSGRRFLADATIFCGDIIPYIPNDASRFITIGAPLVNGDRTYLSMNSYSYSFQYLWSKQTHFGAYNLTKFYGADGSPDFVNYGLADGAHSYDEYKRNRNGQRKGLYRPVLITVTGQQFDDTYATDPDGVLYSDSVKYPQARGELPGLVTEVFASLEEASWPHTEVHLGHEHWYLRSTGYTLNILVNMVEWQ
jgi:hypothetical protein